MAINFNEDVTRTSSDSRRKNVPYPKLGPYKLQYPLGQGGMGQVFKGIDTVLQRSCAVKILPGELSTEKSFRARFRAEAAVLASFDHEHVVRVYGADIEKVADGREEFYIGMELVDGGDLKQFVKKRKDLPKPQDVERILREILEALKYAHGKGVMHRDLKPENILVKKFEGTVKVSDFGLATVVGDSYRDQLYEKTITQGRHATDVPTGGPGADVIGGTFQYMSPEAKRGEDPSVRDDIYSIGLIAYFLLTVEEASVTAFAERPKEINKRWYRFILGCIKSDLQMPMPR